MSEHDSTLPGAAGPTRRTIVRVGAHTAWAAPVILAASTAPAFASSGTIGTFTINRGTSEYTVEDSNAYIFFGGLFVIADGPDIDPDTLQMSITSSGDELSHFFGDIPGGRWTLVDLDPTSPQSTFTYVYNDAVSGALGAPNIRPAFIATFQSDGTMPTFTVQITHPNYATALDVYTPPARRSARIAGPPAGV